MCFGEGGDFIARLTSSPQTSVRLLSAARVLLVFTLTTLNLTACVPSRSSKHLRTEPLIEYYLNKEANDLTEITVRETFERWGEVTHFDFVYRGRHRAGLRRDGKSTVSFLVKWPEAVPIGKVGYCKNWYNRKGDIIESDIIFNMMIAKFTTLRTNKADSYLY